MSQLALNLLLWDDDLMENDLLDSWPSSEGEDEVLNVVGSLCTSVQSPRVTIQNYCENVVPTYSDVEFHSHFRLTRDMVRYITERFENSEPYQKLLRGTARTCISAEKHVLAFIWFAAHQTTSFRDLCDRFDLALSSLHEVITRMMEFLNSIEREIIKLPSPEHKAKTKRYYQLKGGLPHTIGAIDGSHIKIDTPTERKIDYFNRKCFYSVIVQAVCDEHSRFLDVHVGFPGSVHDARVFRNSSFFRNTNNICTNGDYILGDSAYPLLPMLMTPYRDNGHLSVGQKKFNRTLSSSRVCIEHAFGILKQRWRQLYHLKLRGINRICQFIMACCVLHNMALNDGLSFEDTGCSDEQPETIAAAHEGGIINDDRGGHQIRDEVCNSMV